jgi:hypothetical protein
MPELNLHWTDDEDLLARFVLNRVEAAEREQLEAHLRSCERCRRAVEAEQLLAAGIRKAGRDQLKARLRERVVPRKKFEVTWYQVAGAAAAIVVLVSIGLYNRWFISGVREQPPMAAQQNEVDKLEMPADRSKPIEKDREKGPSPAAGAGTARPRGAAKGIAAEAPQVPFEAKSNRALEPKVAPLQIAAAQAEKEPEALDKGTLEARTVWVEGTVLSQAREDRAVLPAGKKAEQQHARKMEEPAPAFQQQALVRTKEAAGFIITQLPASDLPESRRQERQRSNAIQTLLGRTGEKLHLTIYLDTLVTDPELQEARIVPISEDSIILNLGSQQIGFKIPPGWSQETLKQTGRKQ